jgi:hypothetical protein
MPEYGWSYPKGGRVQHARALDVNGKPNNIACCGAQPLAWYSAGKGAWVARMCPRCRWRIAREKRVADGQPEPSLPS